MKQKVGEVFLLVQTMVVAKEKPFVLNYCNSAFFGTKRSEMGFLFI